MNIEVIKINLGYQLVYVFDDGTYAVGAMRRPPTFKQDKIVCAIASGSDGAENTQGSGFFWKTEAEARVALDQVLRVLNDDTAWEDEAKAAGWTPPEPEWIAKAKAAGWTPPEPDWVIAARAKGCIIKPAGDYEVWEGLQGTKRVLDMSSDHIANALIAITEGRAAVTLSEAKQIGFAKRFVEELIGRRHRALKVTP